jgi:5-enolpyruvylshikimate-3-phosphate synthase
VMLDTQNDHRLVIAFTLLALHFPQLTLSETDSVAKSYTGFFELLQSLRQD